MIRSGFDRPNLSFDIVPFEGKGSKARKLAMLLHGLGDEANRPAIVYCGTRKDTEEVAQSLREAGLSAAGYHAGMAPDERASAQHRFMTGDAEVIVATNAFGMGVDKANVRSVWHWAIPTSVEAYYQEAGRAGRDGLPARAVLLAGRSDLGRLVRFIQMREVEPESVSLYAQRLKAGSDRGPPHHRRPARRRGPDQAGDRRASRRLRGRARPRRPPGAPLQRPDRHGRRPRRLQGGHGPLLARLPRGRVVQLRRELPAPEAARPLRGLDPGRARGPLLRRLRPGVVAAVARGARDEGEAPELEAASPPADLSPEDEALLEALRAWRLKAARGKPAYTVANNRTLEAIAASRPADLDALAQIHGVGPAFVGRHMRRSPHAGRDELEPLVSSSIRGVIRKPPLCMESGTSVSWEGLSRPAPASSTSGSPRDCSL